MIASLCGKIKLIGPDFVVLDVNGVGYQVFCAVRKKFKKGKIVTLLTHLEVKEESLTLFGFEHEEELELFRLLCRVRGCGPKIAMRILAHGSPADVSEALVAQDLVFFSSISGVGKKLAEKLIFELKSRFDAHQFAKLKNSPVRTQALEALMSLGYKQREAYQALKAVPHAVKTTEECVREALRLLAK